MSKVKSTKDAISDIVKKALVVYPTILEKDGFQAVEGNFMLLITRDGSVIDLDDMQSYDLTVNSQDGSWRIKAEGMKIDIINNVNNSLERRLRRHLGESILQDISGEAGR